MKKRDRDQLYRDEEAKADRFAGRVMADLGIAPDRICGFLLAAAGFEAHPPEDYYPAPVRAEMIREAHRRRALSLKRAAALLGEAGRRRRNLR